MGWLDKVKRLVGWEPPFNLDDMSDKYLIVGLGNPGPKYDGTRHNIGFAVINRLAGAHGIELNKMQKNALTGFGRIADRQVILAKPLTYMNRSGDSIGPLADYYRIPPENILAVYDEIDLPFAKLRLRESGGSGGHNGMKSLINHLGNDFPRLRVGVGRPNGRMEPAAYVLQKFGSDEAETVAVLIEEAVAAVETFLRDGIQLAMTRHN